MKFVSNNDGLNPVGCCRTNAKIIMGALLVGLATLAGSNSSYAATTPKSESKVTICHVPPGDLSSPQTLIVSASAVQSHMANHPFDTIGSCSTNCAPGVCDDGNACTQDSCLTSGCAHAAIDCNDGNLCTSDSCSTTTGCVYTNNTSTCNDSSACTENDTCSGGQCVGTNIPGCCVTDADCNDNSTCTTDSCNAGTCSHVDVPAPAAVNCKVSVKDPTQEGCWVQTNRNCNDSIACTTDSCSQITGECIHATTNSVCSSLDTDALTCTNAVCEPSNAQANTEGCVLKDTCQCNGTTDPACNDNNTCTTDSCGSDRQCTHSAIAGCCNSATDCGDSNPCTTDTCGADNKCTHTTISCDDGNICTSDSCGATGCLSVADTSKNGQTCDDGNSSTTNDVCTNGVCAGSVIIVLNPCLFTICSGDQCNDGACTAVNGAAVCSLTPKANGTGCDDGNASTSPDMCSNGTCSGGTIIIIDPGGGGGGICTNPITCPAGSFYDNADCRCECNPNEIGSTCCGNGTTCSSGTCTNVNTTTGIGTCGFSSGLPCDSDLDCDDHNATTRDTCSACSFGACTGGTGTCSNTSYCAGVVCGAPANSCGVTGYCEPTDGTCHNTAATCGQGTQCCKGATQSSYQCTVCPVTGCFCDDNLP